MVATSQTRVNREARLWPVVGRGLALLQSPLSLLIDLATLPTPGCLPHSSPSCPPPIHTHPFGRHANPGPFPASYPPGSSTYPIPHSIVPYSPYLIMDQDASSSGGWRFAQCFGDKGEVEDITEADIISTVEFDSTGNYLATGDKGGRVVLFERNEMKKTCEYKFYTEFQSHEPEFDYLKSLEIEEKINKIKWCKRQNAAHFLLSTNDKTIKLWKVFEKQLRVVSESNLLDGQRSIPGTASPQHLRLPRMERQDNIIAAVPRKETYISADDLRINLWNLDISDRSFNIVDIKPVNMEELTEVITAAEFHPVHCNLFMYSSSKSNIKLADMRDSALCDKHAKMFEEEEDPTNRSFFSEIISSISDVKFSHDGRYILSRDYLNLKIWDINMENRPLKTIPIHDHLRGKLCDLYENDCIFDKFECVWSGDDKHVLTGSYHNYFRIYDCETLNDVVLQADKSAFKAKKIGGPLPGNKAGMKNGRPGGLRENMALETLDFNKKILHASWHPRENTIAIAATNNLFLYSAA
uniref:Protein phosphatase PP2A regulatory subunit B n=1 Tax=Ganoderma boninense TaxID=34458 RepID=A0A5K1JWY0_9APHY|nr:Transcriptional repressor rco-1 [Ganoderma boninense]